MISTLNGTRSQTQIDDVTQMSAAQLAQHIAAGDISATDAVEAHIERIEGVNPTLNAVVVKRYEAARAEARAADARRQAGEPVGPLHGLPVTVKECLDLDGTPSTFGLPSRATTRATKDERHVARLRDAGAIVLGKTNVAQLLFYYESDNPLYGTTKNPWNPARTPGGSSGGEAAIIAAGGSTMGLGTDIGGSLRVPAHFCGIASLKPTAGRTPDLGRFSVPVGQQAVPSQVGVLARRVEDVALGLDVINGGANPAVEPPMPLGDFRAVDVRNLRVAWYTNDGTFAPAPAVTRAVREAAEMLRGLGAQVTEWTPPDAGLAMGLLYGIFGADGGRLMRGMLGQDKQTPQIAQLLTLVRLPHTAIRGAQGLLNAMGQRSMAMGISAFGHSDTAHYWQLAEMVMDYGARFHDALDNAQGGPFDVIVCPPCSLPAFTHGASKDVITAGAYACLYNVLGYPAGVVPVTRVREDEGVGRPVSKDRVAEAARLVEEGSAGLPVGVQVVARPWREHVALAAMSAIEGLAAARPDFPRTPVDTAPRKTR
ncbi:MAG: amidase family protein [Anaerolineae bacterium]